MKAITISQPYASLIASGEKWVENRTWPTKYRGPLAIHAGKGTQYMTAAQLTTFPNGCVLAVATLVACWSVRDIRGYGSSPEMANEPVCEGGPTWRMLAEHEHTEGPWCWFLQDIKRYTEPVPQQGAQGLWNWNEPDLVEYC